VESNTVRGSEFQTAGAECRKLRLTKLVLENGCSDIRMGVKFDHFFFGEIFLHLPTQI